MKALDLAGEKYNFLTCVSPTKDRKGPSVVWECLCDCGNICYKPADAIRDGRNKSCGCHKYKSKYGSGFNKVFKSYTDRCLKRDIQFKLSDDEFYDLTQQNCFYCGLVPEQAALKDFIYNGIDRVNNEEGYYMDNCVPCCKRCNAAKSNMTLENFKIWICQIYTTLNLDTEGCLELMDDLQ